MIGRSNAYFSPHENETYLDSVFSHTAYTLWDEHATCMHACLPFLCLFSYRSPRNHPDTSDVREEETGHATHLKWDPEHTICVAAIAWNVNVEKNIIFWIFWHFNLLYSLLIFLHVQFDSKDQLKRDRHGRNWRLESVQEPLVGIELATSLSTYIGTIYRNSLSCWNGSQASISLPSQLLLLSSLDLSRESTLTTGTFPTATVKTNPNTFVFRGVISFSLSLFLLSYSFLSLSSTFTAKNQERVRVKGVGEARWE